ncbi:MAG: sirohydrochlorin cobaltochelatase [Oscillospiraceae bacterium]|nr:sirohydrochlorin cobaltochelatase [Oscillospiraceae bacterium]
MKKIRFVIAALMALSLLTACGGNNSDNSSETLSDAVSSEETSQSEDAVQSEYAEAAEDEENYDTGDASLDNIRNGDNIGENELLAVSFGTSYNDSRRLTVGAIENDLEAAFPEFSVRRGFTSNIIIDHVMKRDGILIDDIDAALSRAADNGVKNLIIQPTHLMNGIEYDEIVEKAANYSDAFEKVVFGEPLLTSDEDISRVVKAVTEDTKAYNDGNTAVCFMGHGTEHSANAVYEKLQDAFVSGGFDNYFIGTVEASPSLEDVMAAVKNGGYSRVVLQPMMVVAGDHANNDMAGDEDGSWKRAFEDEGFEVICVLKGLGEIEEIRQIYVDHARAAIDSLN